MVVSAVFTGVATTTEQVPSVPGSPIVVVVDRKHGRMISYDLVHLGSSRGPTHGFICHWNRGGSPCLNYSNVATFSNYQ